MFEVAVAGEDHADIVLVAAVDGFLVADGASGLDDGGDAGFVGQFHAVIEGEESIRGEHGAMEVEAERLRFLDGLPQGVNSGGLADAGGAQLLVFGQRDGVGAAVLDHLVGEDRQLTLLRY